MELCEADKNGTKGKICDVYVCVYIYIFLYCMVIE